MRLLLEIGVEELPSRYVDLAVNELSKNLKKQLELYRVAYSNEKLFNSPRRIALVIDIDEKQKDFYEKKYGPSKELCYKDGELTKAALGFLKSQNVLEKDMKFEETEKGTYLFIEKDLKGQETKKVLSEILDSSIRSIDFDKTMKWGDKSFRFARPIKWLLVLLDNEVFDFNFEGIKAGNITRGMRYYASQDIVINNIDEYENKLFDNYVVVSPLKRKEMIIESIKNNCEKDNDKAIINEYLLDEVKNLVEYPFAIKGEFNKDYLLLPEDIITITMETHQRYFPVRDENNRLTNKFILIRNAPEYSELVKKGNEKVIEPRLADAKFFYDEDLKVNLYNNVEKLKEITLQKDMGSIYENMQRSLKLAKYINANQDTLRAIELSKADLVSNVISEKEFTSLQGMMGSIYAKYSGENDIVSQAIAEHYLPRFTGDELPKSIEGSIVAITDKLSLSIGAFCVGLKPTSSKDPYAIRRAVQGICSIAINQKLDIDYIDLIEKAYNIFIEDKKLIYSKALEDFKIYFKQRLEYILTEKYDKKIISYIINKEHNFKNIIEKLEKLSKLENMDNLINILKRVKNIVKEEINKDVDETLFENEYEDRLYKLILELENKEFTEIIDLMLSKEKIINSFFDNVMIKVENEKLSINRISLLSKLLSSFKDVLEI